MDKARQKQVNQWLRAQRVMIKRPLYFNVLLGCISAVLLVLQTWGLAFLLEQLIVKRAAPSDFVTYFIGLSGIFVLRAGILYWREKIGFTSGQRLRSHIRAQVLDKLALIGPVAMKQRPAGSWATIVLEQVENLHNFYARYLPQQYLSMLIPLIIVAAVFPINWVAGAILLITAPLIPVFMALVGLKAAETSQKNITVLQRLSGRFLDRLRGLETLRLFDQAEYEQQEMTKAADEFRITTMDVLKVAFLSSAVLEFFTSISIAMMAVYFGFSYLGQIEFGHHGMALTLFVGFFSLILAPEFYQPLRDLGTYYHDRAAAIGAADSIEAFISQSVQGSQSADKALAEDDRLDIAAHDLEVLTPDGRPLSGKLHFHLKKGERVALVGQSGAGKSSLMNVLLGFLPYRGSLRINGVELRELDLPRWRERIAWVGQNPLLLPGSIRENVLIGNPHASDDALWAALEKADAATFVSQLGLDYVLQEGNVGLSGGQIQRLAVARAILRHSMLLLLDEPTASLDANSESAVLCSLAQLSQRQTTLMITHRIEDLRECDQIWVMRQGEIVQNGQFDVLSQSGYFAQLLNERQYEIN
ncbi:cysteine/glutathione ABC transporter permease/ATP-binding protein CydD [Pasteurellaceae bacterium HPA106]|uniref:heme ABC transporter permease/ATP-binding protein CydD n=1 Tax=Spirabiliibacterium pneumoniae TaxID=221400 RepID=UPI001AAD59A7|nr:cysteine/glutathione ABC transporter permease/ATP-binding protein CydD [Spirabiliibacterium pneumoniae]MBE2895617.1 cysteine/glutathione ABC transporter permease/ATP-binding protein CydD [Spirabiliibacterium pneumoniae]